MNLQINSRQSEAIQYDLKPILVLAGAGSGKTFVLTQRINYLINEKKISPNKIWAITFTNKASKEIKERVKKACGYLPQFISTFHGSCVWILRKHIHLINRCNRFKIIDDSEQLILVRRIMKALLNNVNDFIIKPKRILSIMMRFKSENYNPNKITFKDFYSFADDIAEPNTFSIFQKIYSEYEDYLLRENLIDFEDILNLTEKILDHKEALTYWQNFFDAVLIDEFQDTNDSQFNIVSKIASKHKNIFAVGDPDQSIYGWRGAKATIINDFQCCFPETKIILLEQNYRSTQKILNVANELIKNNIDRIEKNLFTKNDEGFLVETFMGTDSKDEANWISDQIIKLKENDNIKMNDVLVLFRSNFVTKTLEEAFGENGIKCKLWNGIKFYQRAEIKTIIAYLNLVLSDDPLSIEHIYNTPKRKISEASFEIIHRYAQLQKISLIDAFKKASSIPNLSNMAIKGCEQFCEVLAKLKILPKENVAELIGLVFEFSGYKASLDQKLDNYRFENIKHFQDTIAENQRNNPSKSLNDILGDIALHFNDDENNDDDQNDNDKVNLMTIHTAKGLEYPYVFVSNMTEGIFPSSRSLSDFDKVAEERRLAYVALTRAKKKLFLSGSKSYDYVKKNSRGKSRFLAEAEKSVANIKQNNRSFFATHLWKNNEDFFNSKINKSFNSNRSDEKNQIVDKYRIGTLVVHEKFGSGTVIGIGYLGPIKTLKIKFKSKKETIEILASNKCLRYYAN